MELISVLTVFRWIKEEAVDAPTSNHTLEGEIQELAELRRAFLLSREVSSRVLGLGGGVEKRRHMRFG